MMEEYKGDAYCVKCKEKRGFEGFIKISESGRRMAYGICPVCGTKVNRILGLEQPENESNVTNEVRKTNETLDVAATPPWAKNLENQMRISFVLIVVVGIIAILK